MNFSSLTDKHIASEIGHRLKALRLRKNITQKELADSTILSLNTIKALESGRGKLSSLIAVMRSLNALADLDKCIPEISISPLQLAKRQGKTRQRASGERLKDKAGDEPEW